MPSSPGQFFRRHATGAYLPAALLAAACGEARESLAPGPGEREQRRPAATVITWPAQPLADFPISMRLSDEVEGASYQWMFSDGTRAGGARVTKRFADSGTTFVNVRVSQGGRESYSVSSAMVVSPSIAALATTLTGINPGGLHNCAIDATQSLYCWGYNGNGNLGDGTTTNRMAHTSVGTAGSFAQVSTGFAHSCALTTAGAVYCWGRNYDGQLGDGSFADRLVPTLVQGGLTFASLDVGYDHSCAVTDAGAAYCWGGNRLGQLGDGQVVLKSNVPRAVAGGRSYTMVRTGYLHSCAIEVATGAAYCWGSNRMGQAGTGSTADSVTTPSLVSGGHVYTQLDAGGYHTCAVTDTRDYCWGWNGSGQLGANATGTCGTASVPCSRVPLRLNGSLKFTGVSTGTAHSCGIESTGVVHCWGHNANGQLGDSTTTNQTNAKRLHLGPNFKTVSARGSFTCGVSLENRAYCWGSNLNGKLGLGDTTDRLVPTVLPNLTF